MPRLLALLTFLGLHASCAKQSLDVPVVLSRLNAAVARHPLRTSLIVTGCKAAAADFMVQKMMQKRRKVDKRRLALFALFGTVYQGGFQYLVLNRACEYVWPGQSFRMVLCKVLFANLVSDPFIFFPTFYIMQEALYRGVVDASAVQWALRKYRDNCVQDWRNSWLTWFPGHTVTFALVPPHLRMPWIASISFVYVGLLSWTRGGRAKTE